MPEVEIYTSPFCGYCSRAKSLLKQKGAPFQEINVALNRAERQAMMQRAHGAFTVPQIFIGGQHIGGCDDLYALDRAGKLDTLLER